MERNIDLLPLAHLQLGTWLTTQACALTRNWTGDLSVHRPVLNPLSHISQGNSLFFIVFFSIAIYPPYSLFHLHSTLQAPHCCPCPWVLFIYRSIPPHQRPPPELSALIFLKYVLLCYYTYPNIFLPFLPLVPVPSTFQHSPTPLVHVHGLYI